MKQVTPCLSILPHHSLPTKTEDKKDTSTIGNLTQMVTMFDEKHIYAVSDTEPMWYLKTESFVFSKGIFTVLSDFSMVYTVLHVWGRITAYMEVSFVCIKTVLKGGSIVPRAWIWLKSQTNHPLGCVWENILRIRFDHNASTDIQLCSCVHTSYKWTPFNITTVISEIMLNLCLHYLNHSHQTDEGNRK